MPSLMRRSLMRMGQGSLVVCVPKGWAAYFDLKAGDRVEVIANGELVVRPLKKTGKDGKGQG